MSCFIQNNIASPVYPPSSQWNSQDMWMHHKGIANHCCRNHPHCGEHNIVKDYRMLENHPDPGQVSLRQNVNTKRVRLENNARRELLIGISIHRNVFHPPKPRFRMYSGDIRDLALNMPGEQTQYIWIFDEKGNLISEPHAIHNHMNLFVIVNGQNKVWVMDFRQPGYNAQH